MGRGYNGVISGKFLFFRFRRGFSCKWWGWGRNRFRNIRDRKFKWELWKWDSWERWRTVTLNDAITNETKEVPVVVIEWFMISKAIKKSKNGYSQIKLRKLFVREKWKILSRWRIILPDEVFPDKVPELLCAAILTLLIINVWW